MGEKSDSMKTVQKRKNANKERTILARDPSSPRGNG